MLRAYFDASQTFQPTPIIAVAGWLSDLRRWNQFERAWRNVLADSNLDHFHMTEFENRRGPYRDWPQRRREEVLGRLVRCICATKGMGVAVALSLRDFEALDDAARQRLDDNPYSVCAILCIGLVTEELKRRGIAERVAYVFERGDLGQGQFREELADYATSERWRAAQRLRSLDFEDKKLMPGLQAADLLAYEATHQVPRQLGIETRPTRWPIRELVNNVMMQTRYLGEPELRACAAISGPAETEAFRRRFGLRPQRKQQPPQRRRPRPTPPTPAPR
jgi:hypothetical protein